MINGAPFNVLDYGADNTGTVDSTSQLQAAMNAAAAAGIALEFASGTYLKNAELVIPNGINMFCNGSAIIKNTVGAIKGFATNATGSTRYYISVKGIYLQCPAATAGTIGWDLVNVTDSYLENFGCISDNGTDGFVIGVNLEALPTGAAWRNQFFNIGVRTKTDASAIGVKAFGTSGNSCNMLRMFGGYVKADSGTALYLLGDNNYIESVNFEGSSVIGVDVADNLLSNGNVIIGCRFEGNTTGIRFGSAAEANAAIANFFTSGMATKVDDIGEKNWSFSPSQLFQFLINRGRFEAVNATDTTKGLFLANAGASTGILFDARRSGDAYPRWQVDRSGELRWSTGAADSSAGLVFDDTGRLRFRGLNGATLRTTMSSNGTTGFMHVATNGSSFIASGADSPEGVITAPVGSLWLRTNGGTGTTLYVKESGSGNTGWAAK